MHEEMSKELFEGAGKELFEKHKDLMQEILDKRVFYVDDHEGEYYLAEACDGYFTTKLTPEICSGLSDFFKDLGDYIKDK